MTIEERADKAAELKATGQCNCTQSVLKVFEDVLPVDDETLMKMSAGFAAGMGGMQSTCGALIGAAEESTGDRPRSLSGMHRMMTTMTKLRRS